MSFLFFRETPPPPARLTGSVITPRVVLAAGLGLLGLVVSSGVAIYRHFHQPHVFGLAAPKRPITVAAVSAQRYFASVAPRIAAPPCLPIMVDALGLADGVALRAEAGEWHGSAVYLPGTDTIVAPLGDRTPVAVLAHERAHAIQDQYVPLDSLFAARTSFDGRAAVRAILEGVAVMASDTTEGRRETNYGDDVLVNWERLAYVHGPVVVRAARARGRSLLAQTASPPTTTWELLFPEPLPADRATPAAVALNPEATLECTDELGALAVYTAAFRQSRSHVVAARVAYAWRGDRVDVYRLAGQRYARWTVRFSHNTPQVTARWLTWYPPVPEATPRK